MIPELKICGMKHNILEVASLQPDYLGFIFYDKSKRNFDGEIPQLPHGIRKVGVFVNAPLEDISEKIRLSQPTTSQHLQVIKKSGLLRSKFEGKAQYYYINKDKLTALKELFTEFFETTERKCC